MRWFTRKSRVPYYKSHPKTPELGSCTPRERPTTATTTPLPPLGTSATAKSFVCPVCSVPIRRASLHLESIEQVDAARDRQERRKVAKVFNKSRADFESAEEYNSFLETAEDIVYKLVHG